MMLELYDYFLKRQAIDLTFGLKESVTNIPLEDNGFLKDKILYCFVAERTDDGTLLSTCALLPEEAHLFELYSYNTSDKEVPMICIIRKELTISSAFEIYTLEKENKELRKIVDKIIKTNTTPLRLYEQFEKFQEECVKTLEKLDNLKKDSSYREGFNSLKEYFNI